MTKFPDINRVEIVNVMGNRRFQILDTQEPKVTKPLVRMFEILWFFYETKVKGILVRDASTELETNQSRSYTNKEDRPTRILFGMKYKRKLRLCKSETSSTF